MVKNALALSQVSAHEHLKQVERDTVGILFRKTPHRVSDIALFTKFIANIAKSAGKRTNTNILEVVQRHPQLLALVEVNFSNWLRKTAD